MKSVRMSYQRRLENYRTHLAETLRRLDLAQIESFIAALESARRKGRTVFVFGNGGSGSTASHMASDLNKGASFGQATRFRVICLNDNMPMLMAYANDVSYADVFVEPLKNFLRRGDLVVGISGSGNSENVILAIDFANRAGALTVGLCGYDGGRLKKVARLVVHVVVDDMQVTEDLHLAIGHMAMQALSVEDSGCAGMSESKRR